MNQKPKKINRRQFLKRLSVAAVGAAGFPSIVPASVLGKSGAATPSNRIVMAGIGFGMMGIPNMRNFLEKDEVQWVAVCDVDEKNLMQARNIVNNNNRNNNCSY